MIKEKIDIGRNLLAVICKCNNLQTEWALHLFASTVDLIKVVNQISVHWWAEPTDPTLIRHLNFNMCTVHVWDECRFVAELFLADTANQVCDLQMNLKEKTKKQSGGGVILTADAISSYKASKHTPRSFWEDLKPLLIKFYKAVMTNILQYHTWIVGRSENVLLTRISLLIINFLIFAKMCWYVNVKDWYKVLLSSAKVKG